MIRLIAGMALLAGSSAAGAASVPASTDFGIRVTDGAKVLTPIVHEGRPGGSSASALTSLGRTSLTAAVRIGARWGRVTSTYRSPAHNRAVGGVRNSFHLSGRAIDIARRAGVRHADIAAAFRSAGYRLVESLDEGDHSHFAFAFGAPATVAQTKSGDAGGEQTSWRFVYAPGGGR